MDYTTKYVIDNNKILAKMLAYFYRGRKLFAFIQSTLSPVNELHQSFLEWAQSLITETKVQFIKRPMEILMKQELGSYFLNQDDEFDFNLFAHKKYSCYINKLGEGDDVKIYPANTGAQENAIIYKWSEVTGSTINSFNLSAPNVADPENKREYLVKIRNFIAKYTMIKRYDIIIQDL